uniref:Uncharacterized protein n=1 Tax=Arundo donax TaxID=35708 RepID=A0A0A8ZQA8_ARUDO
MNNHLGTHCTGRLRTYACKEEMVMSWTKPSCRTVWEVMEQSMINCISASSTTFIYCKPSQLNTRYVTV